MRLAWKPSRVFYGWWIVGVCFFLSFYTGGAIFFGFTAFFEPMANEFGWSYAQIALVASLRGLEVGLLAPLVGLLIDRWGPRWLLFGGAVVSGLGLMLVSRATSAGMLYGTFALVAVGASALAPTAMITAVANWFRRKMSIAVGIMNSGFGFSGLLVPAIVRLINIFGWRTTMLILGLGMWGIALPLSLLVRHKPEQYGYLPDGDAGSAAVSNEGLTSAPAAGEDMGVKQAVLSRTFWHIALATMFHGVVISAVITHVMPYLSSVGISRSTSGLVAGAIPLISITGRLGFGWLGDRVDKRHLTAGGFALMSLGLLFFAYAAEEMWLLLPFLILFSVGFGGNVTMRAALLRQYFGRSKFGTIFGVLMGMVMLGNIIGAPLAGWVFDNWGSYQGIWFVFAGLDVVAMIILVTTPLVPATVQLSDRARG